MADQDNRDEFVFEDEINQEEPEYTKESYDGATENIKSLPRIIEIVKNKANGMASKKPIFKHRRLPL